MFSKYQYIEQQKGYRIAKSHQEVIPESASEEVASALAIEQNHPVLKVISLGELEDGQRFEYTIHYFRVNQYRFSFTARRGIE
ncbi:UTRA domain-containing protein [Celerinatantimonas sp. MCCC 1A17872]|uniref:UTRA domain-containing protein n=1 Tax=Celerinatantimonas sp. MCCC 1A17872 TaxID=3177514 RepID=UPI0038CACE16